MTVTGATVTLVNPSVAPPRTASASSVVSHSRRTVESSAVPSAAETGSSVA